MASSALLRTFLILIPLLHHTKSSSAHQDSTIGGGGGAPVPSPSLFSSPPVVPALFVIGDSSVDCGTNNFLGTFARADRPPYGRDFDTHQPTGRFGKDWFLDEQFGFGFDFFVLFDSALRLGLPFVPSYLSVSGSVEAMIRGVNYASAGAGIIFSSGSELVPFSTLIFHNLSEVVTEHG